MTATSQNSILTYRENPALNQSFLKQIIGVYDTIIRTEEEKLVMTLGSVVDCLITTPSLFDEMFMVMDADIKRPSDTMVNISQYVFKNTTDFDLNNNSTLLEEAIIKYSYVGNRVWDLEAKVEKIIKECSEYWEHLKVSSGKLVITKDLHSQALLIVHKLLTSFNTKSYFNVDSHKQMDIYWKCLGEQCKGLLDWAIEESNSVIQPLDIKVTGVNPANYKWQARKFRNDFQASFYSDGLTALGYIVKPFINIVASTNPSIEPFVYIYSERDLEVGRNGCRKIKGKYYNHLEEWLEEDYIYGYMDAINIYKQAKELGLPNYDIESYQNKRTKNLNLWE